MVSLRCGGSPVPARRLQDEHAARQPTCNLLTLNKIKHKWPLSFSVDQGRDARNSSPGARHLWLPLAAGIPHDGGNLEHPVSGVMSEPCRLPGRLIAVVRMQVPGRDGLPFRRPGNPDAKHTAPLGTVASAAMDCLDGGHPDLNCWSGTERFRG